MITKHQTTPPRKKTAKVKQLRGKELLCEAVNHIIEHPETHNQMQWHSDCGTKHCIAGHCQILGGNAANSSTARDDAVRMLGISDEDANWLFSGSRHIVDIHQFAQAMIEGKEKEFFNRHGFNRHGYDRHGFNRHGFNRHGFNRDGYDRHGYNRDGYDRHGFNRDGFNRDGYDRDGFNRDGYDRHGFNRDGYDRHGYNRDGYDRDGYKLLLLKVKP